MLKQVADKNLRVFVVWEPVLATDWAPPSSSAMALIDDRRASQYWDKDRLVSHAMGEHGRTSIVWDDISVYAPGALWNGHPPKAVYEGRPVIRAAGETQSILAHIR